MSTKPRVICIMGPTASGKSDMAVELAVRLGGQIVNSDSMQVYRYLSIGTAAPDASMYAAVRHHLFEYRMPDDECDAGTWAREAATRIRAIADEGLIPIVVGGTFFWVRALFEGLSEIPAASAEARRSVAADIGARGSVAMHAELASIDPVTASRLEPADSQRIGRALEVWRTTGVALSEFHRREPVPAIEADVLKIKLCVERDVLYDRINQRLAKMVSRGLVDEVRAVLEMGFSRDCRPLKSSSFEPVIRFLDGFIDLDAMSAEIAQGHRNYAKRQLTWLRRESGIALAAGDTGAALESAEKFLDA